ncbi:uncharacterized protein TRIADDRAFT_57496 [Trichoplax adhaerens]|uniref:EF-hand domain-containing protein n=1 Tax=Trichoplax adhaerens TaxID=10228 RepID=B3RZL1_TRIAD|nr:hypothetical protein TRIADDRAFT_57496 [Trichoplax adhaerens]EDV24226.1 hypothetical protein TRIADDRAFT_57496 [Trichoplax adhaerens]|eukprot:XP_002113752.1 hypothetical protein TRIADDRAFT_57496 [Trichoplax adhaerens]
MAVGLNTILAIGFLLIVSWSHPSLADGKEKSATAKAHQEEPIFEMKSLANQFVNILKYVPTTSEFWDQYVTTFKPVLIKGIAVYSPAFHTWNRNFLKNSYGNLTVKIIDKKNRMKPPTGNEGMGFDTLNNFLDINFRKRMYIETQLPTAMQKDILVMPFLTCGPITRSILASNLLISLGAHHTQWQRDSPSMLHCLLRGKEEWALIESKYNEKLHSKCEIADFDTSNVAYLDDDEIRGCLRSETSVPWHYAEVKGGDCLYVPHGYSQIVSFKGKHNVGFSVLLDRTDYHDLEYLQRQDCKKAKIKNLNSIELVWDYPGNGHMSMGNINPVQSRGNFVHELESRGLPSDLENLKLLLNEFATSTVTVNKAIDLFKKHIDLSGNITKEQIQSIPIPAWKAIQTILELDARPHNNINYERLHFHRKMIREIIKAAYDKGSKQLDKNQFTNAYKEIGGSNKYAQEIISALDGNKDGIIDINELKDNLNKTVEPYSETVKDNDSSHDVRNLLYKRRRRRG